MTFRKGVRLKLFRFWLKDRMGLYFNPSMSKDNMPFIQLYSGFSGAQQKGLTFYRSRNTSMFSVWHEASLSARGALVGRFLEVREGMKGEICGH